MSNTTEHPEIMTLEEVAVYLRVSERTVYDWAQKGEIPCGKFGTAWRFKRSEMERWVDDRLGSSRRRRVPQAIPVAEVLAEDRVLLMDAATKSEAMDLLADCLGKAASVTKPDELRAEILHREELLSTGIGFGVGVPHARLASVEDLTLAVGINSRDIEDYQSLDETPVRIICMLAARHDQQAQYLKALGAITALLKQDAVRHDLLEAPDSRTAYAILTQQDV